MTHQQIEKVEKSLVGLSALDRLELVERLVHDLRSAIVSEHSISTSLDNPPSEAEFKRQLLASGLMSGLPLDRDTAPRPEFHPVMIDGEPLSETIVRERR